MQSLFFELIQVSLGNRETLSRVPTADEWQQLYDMAERQAILGICFVGVSRLYELSEINANAKSVEFSVESVEKFQFDGVNSSITPNQNNPASCILHPASNPASNPAFCINLPRKLFIRWAGRAAIIQERNEKLDRYCDTLTTQFREAGFDTCILKGQGVAQLYKYVNDNHGPSMVACSEVPPLNSPSSLTSNPNNPASCIDSVELKFQHPASNSASCILHSASNSASCILHSASNNDFDLSQYRQPGDIDMWVNASKERVVEYAKTLGITSQPTYMHVGVQYKDVPVELHYRPTYMRSFCCNRNIQTFCRNHTADWQTVDGFNVPSVEFNMVYILSHIYRHMFGMGIGLRQLIDYYFVLRSYQQSLTPNQPTLTPNHSTLTLLQSFGLSRFAGAVAWVVNYVCEGGGESKLQFVEADERRGRILLADIIQSGNFGVADAEFQKASKSKWAKVSRRFKRSLHLLRYYPLDTLSDPFWRLSLLFRK